MPCEPGVFLREKPEIHLFRRNRVVSQLWQLLKDWKALCVQQNVAVPQPDGV